MKTQYLCLPLPLHKINPTAAGSNTVTARKTAGSSSSVLDRFREAVFRLIMVTTLTKLGGNNNNVNSSTTSSSPRRRMRTMTQQRSQRQSCQYHQHYRSPSEDPQHNEAVADCIEFFKKCSLREAAALMEHDGGDHDSIAARESTASTASTICN